MRGWEIKWRWQKDSKANYIPLATIYGNRNKDGSYTLSALDIKNLNDNLYAIARKIQGGLTSPTLPVVREQHFRPERKCEHLAADLQRLLPRFQTLKRETP